MSSQVFKFSRVEDFLEGKASGEPVSERIESWNEAISIRNQFREQDPGHYYNIKYFASMRYIDRG